jgi:tetratricopeptide (TPR) repeat protein
MAERIEEPEAEAPEASSSGSDGVAAAMTAALRRRRRGDQPDPEFDAFLRKQSRLVDLQTEHLHEQRELILSRLRLGRLSDRLKVSLQMLTILVGVAAAGGVGVMAWQAHEDHGVSIAAFSVPPDLTQRGLTGQVVASQLLDRLSALQAQTVSGRPGSTYANDWGGDIKVEIPETGVSIGELNRYLRQWLGRATRITGEVVRTPAGLAVTARAGANPGATFRGADADLDGLVQQSAEAIYEKTQPYRYAAYLASQGKTDQAIAAYAKLAQTGDRQDRAWAYTGWASLLLQKSGPREVLAKASEALRLDPRIVEASDALALSYGGLGRTEDELLVTQDQLKWLENGEAEGITPEAARIKRDFLRGILTVARGDYQGAVATLDRLPETIDFEGAGGLYSVRATSAEFLFQLHDVSGARRHLAGAPQGRLQVTPALGAEALDDWPTAIALLDQAPESARLLPGYWAERAAVLARLGRLAEAEAVIAPTALDCTQCLTTRGMIRGLAGDRQGSDHWFAQAAARAQTTPMYYTAWGQSLLEQGDFDAAIVKLEEAHRRGPHYADPLELWGEALARKGDYAGAAAKFAEADKYAPRWGRNHLRWGEALMLSGRYAEARAQYQAANGMDLSRPDRAALDVLMTRSSKGVLHG